MIIEMFGLPGSGKTYFVNQIKQDLRNTVKIVYLNGKIERLILTFLFITLHPRISYFFAKVLLRDRFLLLYKLNLLSVSLSKFVKAEFFSIRGYYSIVDEGLLQRLISLAERELSPKDLDFVSAIISRVNVHILYLEGEDFYRYNENQKILSPRLMKGKIYLESWKNNLRLNCVNIVESAERSNPRLVIRGSLTKLDSTINLLNQLISN